jgi:hypothetical protein
MAEWPPQLSSIDCVLHDSKFHLQLRDQQGVDRPARRVHVKDLCGAEVGRLSIQGYEALSSAICAVENLTPTQRWEQLTFPHMVYGQVMLHWPIFWSLKLVVLFLSVVKVVYTKVTYIFGSPIHEK